MKIIVNIAYALLEGDACDFGLFKCDSLGTLDNIKAYGIVFIACCGAFALAAAAKKAIRK